MGEMLLIDLTVNQFVELVGSLFMALFVLGFTFTFCFNLGVNAIKDFFKWIDKKIDEKKKIIEVEDGKI